MDTKLIVLEPGQSVLEQLHLALRHDDVAAACVLSATGVLSRATFRSARAPAIEFQEPLELVSLTGAVSARSIRLSASAADGAGAVYGGRLLEARAATPVTLALAVLEVAGELEHVRDGDGHVRVAIQSCA